MPTLGASVDLLAVAVEVLTKHHGGRFTAPFEVMNEFIAKLGEAEDAFTRLNKDPNWKPQPECEWCCGVGGDPAIEGAECQGCGKKYQGEID